MKHGSGVKINGLGVQSSLVNGQRHEKLGVMG